MFSNPDFFEYAEELNFGEIHFKFDKATGLRAIIAIHSTKLGPALGGTRCIEYKTSLDAIRDALRLAQGMSYKAAMLGIPHGGGKAVLMKPSHIVDRRAYFKALGRFVNELNGRFITAVDSGTSIEDMDVMLEETPYLASSSKLNGDPSPYTAEGVFKGIEAAVKFKLNKSNLSGIHVAVQGLGHVGFSLVKKLHEAGAKLIVSDINPAITHVCAEQFHAEVVPTELIHQVECDVFSPCALGAILNQQTIPQIKAPIIAGTANNQLKESADGVTLHKAGILYAPDYVINAGGLAYAARKYAENKTEDSEETKKIVSQKINNIYTTLYEIFERAQKENRPTNQIVDLMATEKL